MERKGRVEGKVAIVTGAASGIGKRCAERLAGEGARVVLVDRDAEAGAAAAAALGDPHTFAKLDVTDEDGWTRVVADAGPVQILVNAAGMGSVGNIEHTTLDDFRLMYRVNVEGVFLGCRAVFAAMRAGGGGSIINVSSVAGLVGDPELAGYCASKGAVRLLTKAVALHGARGHEIRCNSVHPSFIDTPMVDKLIEAMGTDPVKARARLEQANPLRRLGHVDDVAHMVVYLASDESRFVTGAELVIDGGLTAR